MVLKIFVSKYGSLFDCRLRFLWIVSFEISFWLDCLDFVYVWGFCSTPELNSVSILFWRTKNILFTEINWSVLPVKNFFEKVFYLMTLFLIVTKSVSIMKVAQSWLVFYSRGTKYIGFHLGFHPVLSNNGVLISNWFHQEIAFRLIILTLILFLISTYNIYCHGNLKFEILIFTYF